VQPRFQRAEGADPDMDGYIFALRKGPAQKQVSSTVEMKIASSGDAGVIAGAIAAKLLDGERICLQGIGPNAVNVMVKSVVITRKYLIDENLDIGFRPQFSHYKIDGEDSVGISFNLFAGANDGNSKDNRRKKNAPYQKKSYKKNENGHYKNKRDLKVASHTDAKSLAGQINHMVRNGEPPQVYCIGTDSTNQAIKAIAISRKNIKEDKLDLLVQPRFQRAEDADPDMDGYIFALRKGPARKQVSSTVEMKIASSGDAGVIAGAITAKLKDGDRVCLQGIGPNAVNVMVKSVVISRKYMIDDNMDIGFRPQFSHYKIDGEDTVGISFNLFAMQT